MTSDNTSIKDKVWNEGDTIRGENPDTWRMDAYGNKVRYGSYGTRGKYGWEIDSSPITSTRAARGARGKYGWGIDHKPPASKRSSNKPRNLQAVTVAKKSTKIR